MTTYNYIAYADGGSHNTQYGKVDANTPKEAEQKVKNLYSYGVSVSLSKTEKDTSSMTFRTREIYIMERGELL